MIFQFLLSTSVGLIFGPQIIIPGFIFFYHVNLSSLVVEKYLKVAVENEAQLVFQRMRVPTVGEIR
jgi:hypothetical protein